MPSSPPFALSSGSSSWQPARPLVLPHSNDSRFYNFSATRQDSDNGELGAVGRTSSPLYDSSRSEQNTSYYGECAVHTDSPPPVPQRRGLEERHKQCTVTPADHANDDVFIALQGAEAGCGGAAVTSYSKNACIESVPARQQVRITWQHVLFSCYRGAWFNFKKDTYSN
jgi:hypothetical protein